jgi:glycosyltransferase involved in cell wall biosynthesis
VVVSVRARRAPLVSVVVDNYNYEPYVAAAIESALAQTHPRLEVIVVDDGSTDGSWSVIEGYADRVRAIRKPNGGQASALNAGYEASNGEIVIFLDADDFLDPDAAASAAAAWEPGCSKVQYRLSIVDRQGNRTGALPAANVEMPSGDVIPTIAASGGYVCPVTSGNAFGRSLLEQAMPIPEDDFRVSADGYLNAVAPFFGPVISLDRELAGYRMHGANAWVARSEVAALRRHIEHDWLKERYTLEAARRHDRRLPEDLALRDWQHVLHRLSHLRLDPVGHPAAADTRLGLASAGLRAVSRSPELAGSERVLYGAVVVAVAVAPRRLAPAVVGWATASKPRPAWMRSLRRALRAIRLPGRSSPDPSA